MSKPNKATDAGRVRRHNERSILAELRKSGAASKPDIAKRVALTPQAVNGIFDALLDNDLIREGGKRSGFVGHPSTLYTISPSGAYAIGMEIGLHRLEIALINFAGQLMYRGQMEYAQPAPAAMRAAMASAFASVMAYARNAGIDADRIVGVGVTEPLFATASARHLRGKALEAARQWRGVTVRQVLPHDPGFPAYVEREAVAAALALSIYSAAQLPRSYLYLAISDGLDACLVLDGEVRRGDGGRAGSIGDIPVRLGPHGEMATVGDFVGFAALAERLATDIAPGSSAEDYYRATQDRPEVVESWLRDSAEALFQGIAAVHAAVDLGAVFVQAPPPNEVGDAIVGRVRNELNALAGRGLPMPALQRDYLPAGSMAMAAATLAFHEHFAPRTAVLMGKATSASPPTLSRLS